jgi:hypothetical protein
MTFRSGAIVLLILVAAMTIVGVYGQEAGDPNWCDAGQPWGDGTCVHEDAAIQEYFWKAGWCMAQADAGNFTGDPENCFAALGLEPLPQSSASDEGPGAITGSCSVVQVNVSSFTFSASWSAPADGQAEARFEVRPIEGPGGPLTVPVTLSPDSTSASASHGETLQFDGPYWATFVLLGSGGTPVFGPIECSFRSEGTPA